jgi:hypothetical protein
MNKNCRKQALRAALSEILFIAYLPKEELKRSIYANY